jgi:putative holliday junction resolvase
MKKLLGIDYGEKRVGVAISNEERKMAFPRYVLQNDDKLLEKIAKVCTDEGIEEVVIGRSLDYKNQPNHIMEEIEEFGKTLEKKMGFKVYYENEFLTSAEARRIQGGTDMLDASAAALILRSFIEKEND